MRHSRQTINPIEPITNTTYNKSMMPRQKDMQFVGTAIKVHGAHEPSFVTSYLLVNPPPLQGGLSSAVEMIRPLSIAFTKSRFFLARVLRYPATSYSSNLLCWCSSGVECGSASANVLMPAGYDHSFQLPAFQLIEYRALQDSHPFWPAFLHYQALISLNGQGSQPCRQHLRKASRRLAVLS